MKTSRSHQSGFRARFTLLPGLAATLALSLAPVRAQAQQATPDFFLASSDGYVVATAIFTRSGGKLGPQEIWAVLLDGGYLNGLCNTNNKVFGTNTASNQVEAINPLNGAVTNATFISVTNPWAIAAVGANEIAVGTQAGSTSIYDATTGAVVVPNFINNGTFLLGMADFGGILYTLGGGKVGTYNDTTFAPMNTSFISSGGSGIAVNSQGIFINTGGSVSEYSLSGSLINANLITVPGFGTGVAVAGNDVFAEDYRGFDVIASDTSGNSLGNPLITLTGNPTSILVTTQSFPAIPEPATWSLFAGTGALLLTSIRRRKRI